MKKMISLFVGIILALSLVSAYGGGGGFVVPITKTGGVESKVLNKVVHQTVVIESIDAKYGYERKIDRVGLAVDMLKFNVVNDVNLVSAVVYKDNTPAPSFEGKEVYQHFEIKTTIDKTNIEDVEITFKVERNWFDGKSAKNVFLMHNKDGKWEKLETKLLKNDRKYVYYKAITKSLSQFAVVMEDEVVVNDEVISEPQEEVRQGGGGASGARIEEPVVTITKDTEEEKIEETPQEEKPNFKIGLFIFGLIVLAGIIIIGYFYWSKKEEKK